VRTCALPRGTSPRSAASKIFTSRTVAVQDGEISVKQAAQLLGIPADAIYNWLRHGQVPANIRAGRWCIPLGPPGPLRPSRSTGRRSPNRSGSSRSHPWRTAADPVPVSKPTDRPPQEVHPQVHYLLHLWMRAPQPSRWRSGSGSGRSGSRGVGRSINVEQGAANPSVGTLLRISDALGVGLPALVEPPHPKPVKLTRSGDGAVLWSGQSGGRGVLVAGTEPSRRECQPIINADALSCRIAR
jgi:hypothetical protein